MVTHWNRLPKEAVELLSWELLKAQLDIPQNILPKQLSAEGCTR